MEGRAIAVFIVAGVLGLVAAVLGFAAEATKIKADQVGYLDDGSCVYPTSPSLAMGIVASIILLVEQIVISGATGCFCCRGSPCPSSCRGITALVCFVFSWLVFIGAFVMLIYAAVLNNANALARTYTINDGCPIAKSGLFVGAGVLCIVSIALGLISYVALLSGDRKNISRDAGQNFANEHGVAMAQPQMPAKVQA